jgi:hypothetical protein
MAVHCKPRRRIRRLIEIESGKFTPRQDKLTLDELLDAFLADQKMKGRKALETTTTVLVHVSDFFHGYRAIDVTAPKLRDYVNERKAKNAAPASIQRELSHLRSALRLAVGQAVERRAEVPDADVR